MRRAASPLAKIGLVVSDIDGTLVRDDKSLDPATIAAVKRLQDSGIGFTLISARPPSGLEGLIVELGLDTPVGAFNGATIFRPGGEVIEAHHVPRAVVSGMLETYERHGVPVWIFADGRWMTKVRHMPHVEQEIIAARQEPVLTSTYDEWMDRIDKVQGICDDPEHLAQIERELQAAFGDKATIARSQTYYLDATALHTDKGYGVTELAKAFDMPLARTAVAGDMPNDLPMFRVAGLAVAMGQSSDEVKSEADIVTRSNEENGLAAFLRSLVEARR